MLNRRIAAILAAGAALLLPLAIALGAEPGPPGPPFPAPAIDRAVYDEAGVFRPGTVAALEATIDAIEARTGAEVVVYTQVWPYKIDQETSQTNAAALMDEWGIGRRGFDDGLVILFDLDPSLVHGQVSLYAGSGFRATFLSDDERQGIFDADMVPFLAAGDLDGAALIALERVDAAATPEHATRLEQARQLNAVVGIGGGALALFGLAGWAVFQWLRFGRDPVYVDSASVLVPAPPAGMTAATGTLVLDGSTSRRTLTTALLDLASRGDVAFREERGFLGLGARKLTLDLGPKARAAAEDDLVRTSTDDAGAGGRDESSEMTRSESVAVARSRIALANRHPVSAAEVYLLEQLEGLSDDDTINSDDVPKLAEHVAPFQAKIEQHAVAQGWFASKPSSVTSRWRGIGLVEFLLGGLAVFAGFAIPASGLTLLGSAVIASGIVTFVLASAMPARTMAGAMQRAWLFAYRRTLSKTMDQARSMDQVVREAGLDWLDTPDLAVVWSVALGLAGQVEDVLGRTAEDSRAGGTQMGFLPLWYRGPDGAGLAGGVASGGGGLFASTGMPDIGGMFSTLGTIGTAPSSSGGSGGGFSGGGSGGGGGAGGGF